VDVTPIVNQKSLDPSYRAIYDPPEVPPTTTYDELNNVASYMKMGFHNIPSIDGNAVIRVLPITEDVLKTTIVDKIYLIDPMKYYENDTFANNIMSTISTIPGNNFNELYDYINNYLSEYKDRYTWFRNESLAIHDNQIADESLDCIFIDGDHTYNAVFADLEFWWKKLRVGGQILGDDYWMESVSSAVKNFSKKHNLKYQLLKKEGTNYSIYRFHK
jgi:hypothetical protein